MDNKFSKGFGNSMLICVACGNAYFWHIIRASKTEGVDIMLSNNLKRIRQSKGFTQEELAIKINVVRQTVSKWEKGLSVPDADILNRIAEVLDVSVSELLGAEITSEENKNEIAEQLSKISEQLAIKNRRSKRIWKTIGIVLLAVFVLYIVLIILFSPIYNATTSNSSYSVEENIEENEKSE